MKKRIISLLMAVLMLAGMMSVSAFAASATYEEKGAISLSADKTEVYTGEAVTITVAIVENPGLAGLDLDVVAEGLTVGEIKQADYAGLWETNDMSACWTYEDAGSGKNTTAKGTFATFTVTASAEGTYTVDLTNVLGGIIVDGVEQYVEFEDVQAVTVTVSKPEFIKGDINGDEKVNNKDVTRLIQFIKGKSTDVVEAATDVSGDGKTNNKDVTALIQYIKSL